MKGIYWIAGGGATLCTAAICALVMQSCGSSGPSVLIKSEPDFAPAATPGQYAQLLLAGTSYPVTIKVRKWDTMVAFDLVDHGEIFETEVYESKPDGFSLSGAADEQYRPPLPLVKFPMKVGDRWNWTGRMTTGDIPRNATAVVSSRREPLYVKGLAHETVKVTVDIALEANPGKPPLNRQLQFWFEPGVGVIKREFGAASIRQPPQE